MLLIKVTVTPLLMGLVVMIARRWGPLAGGVAAGLPISSGPISVYLALEHGAEFAQGAALGSLVGLAAIAAMYLAYALATRALSPLACSLVALAAFGGVSGVVWMLDHPFAIALLTLLLVLTILWVTPPSVGPAPPPPIRSRWDVPARIAASLALVLGITGLAQQLGPTLSGLLSPIPVVACPLIVFTHVQDGREAAKAIIRGTTIGLPSVMIFYFAVYLLVGGMGLASAYGAALLLSGIGAVGGLAFLRLSGAARRSGSNGLDA